MSAEKQFVPSVGDWVISETKYVGRVADTSQLEEKGKMEIAFIYDPHATTLSRYLTPYFAEQKLEPVPFVDAELVKVYRLPNNNLLMTLTEESRAELPQIKKKHEKEGDIAVELDLLERFPEIGWEVTGDLDHWGHMTSAPALTDANGWDWPDDAESIEAKYFWYDPDYAIRWWVDELEKNGYFIWTYFNAEPDEIATYNRKDWES